ncbi:helix-turn-helix domain-containing protein [Hathewaya limosa]|uniref:AraC-like DNA-binding protein n=1 Tax=Hathewaya limosa TaxID=1536 RepID=A0ABU0JSW0_HATLI|nr:AraC family transcriptional regulator [Hathewaya limosa]MDQ0480185.1 AraC-like DNA-binding protein [Hathewaya limosa]
MKYSNIHEKLLFDNGFSICNNENKFNNLGTCYKIDPSIGEGYYWVYNHKDMFSLVVHDFYYHEDFYLESCLSEYLSVSYYESVSGEELNPYRRVNAGCVKCYWWYDQEKYQGLFHKNIPIRILGIEFMPKYCDDFLKNKFGNEYINPRAALLSIDETTDFPEMIVLLHQIFNYRGTGISAELFYEGKVAEAMSLILDKYKHEKNIASSLSQIDIDHLRDAASYINDHYASLLTLNQLCKIACMGTTKLKKCFKQLYKCTITEYIQHRRMSQAEHFLTNTELTVGQISKLVGYQSGSRFSELFKKSTGLCPLEYRHFSKRA